jgi:Nuclease-related domain
MFTLSLVNLQHSLTLATCLCLFMLAFHIFVNHQKAKEILDANAARKAEIDLLCSENHQILHSGKGKHGEDAVHRAVLSIFQSLNLQCITNRELHCPQAILLPTGDDKYSKEIDLLVVSEIGVFVIEVKDWRGLWKAKEDQPHLLTKVSGSNSGPNQSADRSAPLLKTQNKLKEILNRANLTDLQAQALVVFTDSDGNVHAQLPPNYLHISELAYYFRQQAAGYFEALEEEGEGGYDVDYLAEQILPCLDASLNALHSHMMRLSPASDSLKTYQSNHKRLLKLESLPELVHQSDRPFRYWVSNMLFFMSLAAVTQALS